MSSSLLVQPVIATPPAPPIPALERPLEPQALVADVSTKPCINFLWGGTLVMMAGFALACVKRSKEA